MTSVKKRIAFKLLICTELMADDEFVWLKLKSRFSIKCVYVRGRYYMRYAMWIKLFYYCTAANSILWLEKCARIYMKLFGMDDTLSTKPEVWLKMQNIFIVTIFFSFVVEKIIIMTQTLYMVIHRPWNSYYLSLSAFVSIFWISAGVVAIYELRGNFGSQTHFFILFRNKVQNIAISAQKWERNKRKKNSLVTSMEMFVMANSGIYTDSI